MFVDEDQWARAFTAAKQEVSVMVSSYSIPHLSPQQQQAVATRIATAALRAAAQDDEGDITELPGVHIDEIGSPRRTSNTVTTHTVKRVT